MATHVPAVKMVSVDADGFESVGYVFLTRTLYVKFRTSAQTVSFQNVPGFRYEGLLTAPRKDAYFKTFIQNQFIQKQMTSPPSASIPPRV